MIPAACTPFDIGRILSIDKKKQINKCGENAERREKLLLASASVASPDAADLVTLGRHTNPFQLSYESGLDNERARVRVFSQSPRARNHKSGGGGDEGEMSPPPPSSYSNLAAHHRPLAGHCI